MGMDSYYNRLTGLWYCNNCSRTFITSQAILDHFVNSSLHIWCSRCDRHFGSVPALQAHFENSGAHEYYCHKCEYDADDWVQLCEHWEEEGCYYHCKGCNKGWMEEHQSNYHHNHEHPTIRNTCVTSCIGKFDLRTHKATEQNIKHALPVPVPPQRLQTPPFNVPPRSATAVINQNLPQAPTQVSATISLGQTPIKTASTKPITLAGTREAGIGPATNYDVSNANVKTPSTIPALPHNTDVLKHSPPLIFGYAFELYATEFSTTQTHYFQSVTAAPGIETLSVEELRLLQTFRCGFKKNFVSPLSLLKSTTFCTQMENSLEFWYQSVSTGIRYMNMSHEEIRWDQYPKPLKFTSWATKVPAGTASHTTSFLPVMFPKQQQQEVEHSELGHVAMRTKNVIANLEKLREGLTADGTVVPPMFQERSTDNLSEPNFETVAEAEHERIAITLDSQVNGIDTQGLRMSNSKPIIPMQDTQLLDLEVPALRTLALTPSISPLRASVSNSNETRSHITSQSKAMPPASLADLIELSNEAQIFSTRHATSPTQPGPQSTEPQVVQIAPEQPKKRKTIVRSLVRLVGSEAGPS